MKNKKNKRWRVFADAKVQGILCLRIAIYWIICQLTVVGTIFGFVNLEGIANVPDGSFWRFVIPALFVSSMMLPIVLLDILLFSNRFAGPVLNFRRKFHLLANNQATEKINFRPGDYYIDLSENFNKLREYIESEGEHSIAVQTENIHHKEFATAAEEAV